MARRRTSADIAAYIRAQSAVIRAARELWLAQDDATRIVAHSRLGEALAFLDAWQWPETNPGAKPIDKAPGS